ncbi:Clp protease ClpS [Flavipsychrobacter stenotrophus]|uniref:Clp protease ClpS n=1 Tax=Flavipsychrobacter stenotrophus TaxID=2077091 RepID=A0A2S7T073_9BACT|nr:ATP-dependent Clp protease adaptor ClpS [Flavipsychrobacter stenotrophus]PQJ12225.1 Clp protease ClpS [Flavipsychrobacter stenotrophus]
MSRLFNNGLPQWEQNEDVAVDEVVEQLHNIIVWNDDVNDFDWVIKSLIEICGHNEHQAEQCAMIIHNAGKYSVKRGTFETLRPQAEALIDRGIQATIDY